MSKTQPTPKESNNPIWKHCNNPLNIRYNPANNWVGQTGEYKGFCVFKSESYGIRAAYKLLFNCIKNGHNTLADIIERWAPPTENDTKKYLRFVCEDVIIDPSEPLGYSTIHDYWTIIIILRAMATMESGQRYDEQQINLYINYPEKYT